MRKKIFTLVVAAMIGAVSFAPDTSSAQPLDAASLGCVECHESYLDITGATVRVTHATGSEHGIGMDYAAASSRTSALAPPSDLPGAMELPAGRIGCTTCHVPYNEADHERLAAERARIPEIPDPLLAIDNAGSALCLACHRK